MPRIVFIALAAVATCLALASTAHAGWVTAGRGYQPVVKNDPACINGIPWGWATFNSDRQPGEPEPPYETIHDLVVVVGSGVVGNVLPTRDVVYPPTTHTVPYGRTSIFDTNMNPEDFLPLRFGTFDYVWLRTLKFTRNVQVGEIVTVQWRGEHNKPYSASGTGWQYVVQNCFLPIIDIDAPPGTPYP